MAAARWRWTAIGILISACCLASSQANSATFDFNTGIGPSFSAGGTGDLWTIGTTGPDVSISKAVDPLVVQPNGFIGGGLQSYFCVDGDFTVTVDFTLPVFGGDASQPQTLSECVLRAYGLGPTVPYFQVLRYVVGTGDQRLEAFWGDGDASGPIGDQSSPAAILTGGRFRMRRSGDVMTASYASAASEVFTDVGSKSGFTGAMKLSLVAVQGLSSGTERANTALEVHFDNLVVDGMLESPCVPLAGPWGLAALWAVLFTVGGLIVGRGRVLLNPAPATPPRS